MKKIILSIALLTKTNFYLHSSSLELSPQEKKSVSSINPFDFQNFDSLQPINNQGSTYQKNLSKMKVLLIFLNPILNVHQKLVKLGKICAESTQQ